MSQAKVSKLSDIDILGQIIFCYVGILRLVEYLAATLTSDTSGITF
jgi:hypothetical protein